MATVNLRYKITLLAETTPVMYVFDALGAEVGGIDLASFAADLRSIRGDRLDIYFNSRGGLLDCGLGMASELLNWQSGNKTITAHVSVAHSAASLLTSACKRTLVYPTALMLVHLPQIGGAEGESSDLRKIADHMDAGANAAAMIYLNKSGNGTIKSWLDQMEKSETLTANRALSLGLADELEQPDARMSAQMSAVIAESTDEVSQLMAAVEQMNEAFERATYERNRKLILQVVYGAAEARRELREERGQIVTDAVREMIDGGRRNV